jgi:hypothetical protein
MLLAGSRPAHFSRYLPIKPTRLQERATFSRLDSSPVDRVNHTISDVKLLGWTSLNGRRYDPVGCGKSCGLYEGARVNIDHGSKTVAGRFGRVAGVYTRDDGLYAKTLHYNPHLPLTEAILWAVENDPGSLGMSHDADAKVERQRDGSQLVTEIIKVNSVDVVSDPATTKGIFESMDEQSSGAQAMPGIDELLAQVAAALTMHPEMSKAEKKAKLADLTKLLDEPEASEEAPAPAETQESVQPTEIATLKAENAKLAKQLDALAAKDRFATNRANAAKLCESVGLPKTAVTDYFLNQLADIGDEAKLREAIEDRRKVVAAAKTAPPRSAPPGGTVTSDLDSFCKQLAGVN